MTDTFVASNGTVIARKGRASLTVERPGTDRLLNINADRAEALREFFRAERDEELARWRWNENPNIIAWASRRSNEKAVTVLDELTGYVGHFTRADVDDVRRTEGLIRAGARAYFEAYPERKPWHDAIPGQAWVVEWRAEDEAFEKALLVADFSVEGRVFADAEEMVTLPLTSSMISAARRIWPGDAS